MATVYHGSFLHAWQPTHVRTTASCFAQVRGGDDPFDIPLYVMCRRWVRNDPYNDEAHVAEPQVGQWKHHLACTPAPHDFHLECVTELYQLSQGLAFTVLWVSYSCFDRGPLPVWYLADSRQPALASFQKFTLADKLKAGAGCIIAFESLTTSLFQGYKQCTNAMAVTCPRL